MSVIAYGQMVRRQRSPTARDAGGEDKGESKLVEAVAALIPAEILAAHAYLVAKWTSTDAQGTTTITNGVALQWSLVVLVLVTVVAYVYSRGLANWKREDYLRLLIPPAAFLAWTGLLGTSALTPWVVELGKSITAVTPDGVVIVAVVIGLLLIALNAKLTPKAA